MIMRAQLYLQLYLWPVFRAIQTWRNARQLEGRVAVVKTATAHRLCSAVRPSLASSAWAQHRPTRKLARLGKMASTTQFPPLSFSSLRNAEREVSRLLPLTRDITSSAVHAFFR